MLVLFLLFSWSYGNTFIVETPTSVEEGDVFEIKVILKDKSDQIKIYGDNFEFLGQSRFSIIKSLVGGRFFENKVYTYRLKPQFSGVQPKTIFLTVQVGNQKQFADIQVIKKKPQLPKKNPLSLLYLKRPSQDSVLIRNYLSKSKLLVNETAIMETVVHADFAIDSYRLLKQYNHNCYQLILLDSSISKRRPKTIGKKRYLSSVIFKYIVYSPKQGECTIEGLPFRVTLIQPNLFFNKKVMDVKSTPVKFTVIDYPQSGRPVDFQFHYGDYDLQIKFSKKTLEVNTPIRLAVSISGAGNFLTLNEPNIHYTPKFTITKDRVVDDFRPNGQTLAGSKTYYYYLTPRATGQIQDTPVLTFYYYSPITGSYKQLRKKIPELEILPHSGYVPSSEDDLRASPDAEIPLHPLYIGNFHEPETDVEGWSGNVGIWYHVLGILGSLIFWVKVRKPLSASSHPRNRLKELKRDIIKIKHPSNNPADDLHNSEDVFAKPQWTELRNLTIIWIQKLYGAFYNLRPEKSWDKQVKKLISSSTLSSQELEILQIFQSKIKKWEVPLYHIKDSKARQKEDKHVFEHEVDEVSQLLEKLLSLHPNAQSSRFSKLSNLLSFTKK